MVMGPIVHAAPKASVKTSTKIASKLPDLEPGDFIRAGKYEIIEIPKLGGGSCSAEGATECNVASQFNISKPGKKGQIITFKVDYPKEKITDVFNVYLAADGETIDRVTITVGKDTFKISDKKTVQSIADYINGAGIKVKEPPTIAKK